MSTRFDDGDEVYSILIPKTFDRASMYIDNNRKKKENYIEVIEMEFVLSGRRYELDLESVVQAADRIVPDDIDGRHKYYVDIGGRHLPVKQLFSEATGLRRAEFITDDAFRIFKRLGLNIEEFDRPHAPTADLSILNPPRTRTANGTTRFAVSLELDEDGYIVASCPQLPGCHSQGKSRQEATKNIQEAIRGYIASMKRHGEEIPVLDWELVEVAL